MVLSNFQPVLDNPATKVVPKLWGSEYHLENVEYCGKLLALKKGFACSLHYHKLKTETFLILAGFVRLEVAEGDYILGPGERHRIDAGVEHRFTGLSESLILELSTHDDPSDSYRLEPSKKV